MKLPTRLALLSCTAVTLLADAPPPTVTPSGPFESMASAEFKAKGPAPAHAGPIEVVPLAAQPWYTAPDRAVARQLFSPSNSRCTSMSLAEIVIPAGVAVREHFHKQREEIYHIVAGHGLMTLNGNTTEVGPGDTVVVHIGERHKILAHAGADLEMLVASVPAWSEADLNFTE
jgi:mannose-6-phosphate isomerase-like protein (cupin superfamily)